MIDTIAKLISFAIQLLYAVAYFSAKSNIMYTCHHDGIISNRIDLNL